MATKKVKDDRDAKELIEEQTLEGMRIIRVGRGQYRAYSQSELETAYAVDILHYGGLGSCTCDDFDKRRKPRWSSFKIRKNYDVFRCKHLRRIRCFVLDQIIAHYAKDQKEN